MESCSTSTIVTNCVAAAPSTDRGHAQFRRPSFHRYDTPHPSESHDLVTHLQRRAQVAEASGGCIDPDAANVAAALVPSVPNKEAPEYTLTADEALLKPVDAVDNIMSPIAEGCTPVPSPATTPAFYAAAHAKLPPPSTASSDATQNAQQSHANASDGMSQGHVAHSGTISMQHPSCQPNAPLSSSAQGAAEAAAPEDHPVYALATSAELTAPGTVEMRTPSTIARFEGAGHHESVGTVHRHERSGHSLAATIRDLVAGDGIVTPNTSPAP